MNSYEHYQEARRLMDQGLYEKAITLFEQNIKSEPHFKELELLGECLMRLERLVEAIIPLAAATTLNQGVRAPSLLAEVFYSLGKTHEANAMAELALRRDPNNRRALQVKRQLGDAESD